MIKKNGNGLYHICYESENFEQDLGGLVRNKFLIVEHPKEAIALEKNRVAFLYKESIGLIEVMEKI